MAVLNRPTKFVVEMIAPGKLVYSQMIAGTSQMLQQVHLEDKNDPSLPGSKTQTLLPVSGRDFFDDIKVGWTFKNFDIQDFDLDDHTDALDGLIRRDAEDSFTTG